MNFVVRIELLGEETGDNDFPRTTSIEFMRPYALLDEALFTPSEIAISTHKKAGAADIS